MPSITTHNASGWAQVGWLRPCRRRTERVDAESGEVETHPRSRATVARLIHMAAVADLFAQREAAPANACKETQR